jgi:hypothetical protein
MSKITAFARLLQHAFTGTQRPTIPPTNDHTDGSWSATDIYTREIATNPDLEATFIRHTNKIMSIPNIEFSNLFTGTTIGTKNLAIKQIIVPLPGANLNSGSPTLTATVPELAAISSFQIIDVKGIIIPDLVAVENYHSCNLLINNTSTSYSFTPRLLYFRSGGVYNIEVQSVATYTSGGITYTNLCNNSNYSSTTLPRGYVIITYFV